MSGADDGRRPPPPPRADHPEADLWGPGASVGAASTLSLLGRRRRRVPPREFAPGFHGAAPGPSHEEDAPARPRPKRPEPKRPEPEWPEPEWPEPEWPEPKRPEPKRLGPKRPEPKRRQRQQPR